MLNKFFGTTANATFAIARQVEGQVYSVSAAVLDTMKPQIMKSFGANNSQRMFYLSMISGKLGFTLMSYVCLPILVYTPEILDMWLKMVPTNTVIFTRLLIAACMMAQITQGLFYASQATGNIKWFSIIVSGLRIIALPISIFLCYLGQSAIVTLIVFCVCESLASLSRIVVISKFQGFNATVYFKDVIFKIMPPFVFSIVLCSTIRLFTVGYVSMIVNIIFTLLMFSISAYKFGLTDEEKFAVKEIVKSFIHRVYA